MGNAHDSSAFDELHEIERHRYNVVFGELGLAWYWDTKTYAELQSRGDDRHPVHAYVERHMPHLLRAYDTDFLVRAIEVQRMQLHGMTGDGSAAG